MDNAKRWWWVLVLVMLGCGDNADDEYVECELEVYDLNLRKVDNGEGTCNLCEPTHQCSDDEAGMWAVNSPTGKGSSGATCEPEWRPFDDWRPATRLEVRAGCPD